MCLNPKIIINPRFIKAWKTDSKFAVHAGSRDFLVSCKTAGDFPFNEFHPNSLHIKKSDFNNFYFYDQNGVCNPIYIETSCGKCDSCISLRRNTIKSRMLLEQYCHNCPPLFLTLTYNPENLPKDGVSVRDVQLFFKRFRSYVEYHFPNFPRFRYMAFSEYAPDRTRRAHYHIILFGCNILTIFDALKLESILTKKVWRKGFCYLRVCDSGCFNYVSKYVCKKSNVPSHKNPNFILSSKKGGSIGAPALKDKNLLYQLLNSSDAKISLRVMDKTFNITVPKNIRNSLFRDPRSYYKDKYIKAFKYLSSQIELLSKHFFSSHLTKDSILKLGLSNDDYSCIRNHCIPLSIYNKFLPLNILPYEIPVTYKRHDKLLNSYSLDECVINYLKCKKYLNSISIPVGSIYENIYFRERITKKWTNNIVSNLESHPINDFSLSSVVRQFNSELLNHPL